MSEPIVKTKINGIPVVIKFLEIGPANSEKLQEFQKDIKKSIIDYPNGKVFVEVIQIDKPNGDPVTNEDLNKVKEGLNGYADKETKKKIFSKTLWFNALTLISTIGVLVLTEGLVTGTIATSILVVVLIANIILRLVTNQPVDMTDLSKLIDTFTQFLPSKESKESDS